MLSSGLHGVRRHDERSKDHGADHAQQGNGHQDFDERKARFGFNK
jgi:hypothetical protein